MVFIIFILIATAWDDVVRIIDAALLLGTAVVAGLGLMLLISGILEFKDHEINILELIFLRIGAGVLLMIPFIVCVLIELQNYI